MSQTSTSALIEEGVDLIARSILRGLDTLRDMRMPDLRSLTSPDSCGCDIPPPCWYPKDAGEVTSYACPGGTAALRVRVHNCGPTRRVVRLDAAGGAKVEPAQLTLGAMEREAATVRVDVPESGERELLVWIRGCHAHYVRWRVVATGRGLASSCHELDIEDCPDYLHHWYDHFYCVHPCTAGRGQDG